MKFIIPKQLQKNTSQIAVIFTIIIAIIIVFVFLFINIAKISDIKTLTSQIADKEGLVLASKMGTYVNKLWIQVQESVKVLGFVLPGTSCEPVKCCAINWGLLLPVLAFVIGIVLLSFIVTLPVSLLAAGLTFGSMPFLAAEINAIMKGTFSRIDMSPETAIRETSMEAMLAAIGGNYDPAVADKITDTNSTNSTGNQTDNSTIKFVAPMPGDPANTIEYYIGKAHPFLDEVRKKNKVSRYVAWYWSKRYPLVGDQALATDMENFINLLVTYFFVEKWDTDNWKILEASIVSRPVDISNTDNSSGTIPKWVIQVPPADSWEVIRAVGPVSSKPGLLDPIVDAIDRKDFLGEEFMLVRAFVANRIPFSLSFVGQDIEDLRDLLKGVTVRCMEVLNLPINQRAVGINTWWPIFWDPNITHATSNNKDDYKEKRDVWEKLKYAQLELEDWILQLNNADQKLKNIISSPNGDTRTGIGSGNQQCRNGHKCYNRINCTWNGIYCSACPGGRPPSCDLGDLYKKKTFEYCPFYPDRNPSCACGSCSDNVQCPAACEYMGEFNSKNTQGPTKLTQVIQILARLNDSLRLLIAEIENFQTRVDQVLNTPSPIKDIALYGWDDKNGGLHLAKVKMDGYPAYKDFPYIREYYGSFLNLPIFKGFLKCREVMNPMGNITVGVSRYDSDVKTDMWTLKYRNKSGGDEFSPASLKTLIQTIHTTGNVTNSTEVDEYMITSKTKAHYEYGPKHALTIERLH